MKTDLFRTLTGGVVALAVVMIGATVQGQSTISFVGSATLNGNLGSISASQFNSISASVLGSSQTGNYSSVPSGTVATFSTPFVYVTPALPAPFWNFSIGPTHYSFTATSLTVDYNTSTFLQIEGNGIAHIDGFSDTLATWSITGTGNGGPQVTFGASIQTVPEPSSLTLLLASAPLVYLFGRRIGVRLAPKD